MFEKNTCLIFGCHTTLQLRLARTIDIDRVNAQQARRVLDRIVGFELSPILWKKIKPAL